MKKLILFFSIFACIMTACSSSGSKSGASGSTKSNPETEAMLDGSWTSTTLMPIDQDEDFYYWCHFNLFLDNSNHSFKMIYKIAVSEDDGDYAEKVDYTNIASIGFEGKWSASSDNLCLNVDKNNIAYEVETEYNDIITYQELKQKVTFSNAQLEAFKKNQISNVSSEEFDMGSGDMQVTFVRPEAL